MISQILFAAAVSAQYAQTTTTTTTVATTPCTTAAPTTTPCTTDAPKATTTPCDVPVVTTQAPQPAYTSPAANVYNAPATTTTKAAYGGPVVAGSAANVASVAAFVAAAFLAL
ncbi:hypothetical protein HDV04_000716 [Boothiomyces sp. JEL0838]|nr:hypothetical protein HDV04_000716 [Boothiomyces sp. JEL0838]